LVNNVNAPAQLSAYANEHNLDLSRYHEIVESLTKLGRFIDVEPPFADDVLIRLRTGMSMSDAVDEARTIALAALNAQS
jgi:hypothetical protein